MITEDEFIKNWD